MKKQDFGRKITIVVDRELPIWQVLNTVGHISAYFGFHLKEQFSTAPYFKTLDEHKIPRNSQYPIIILSTSKEELQEFAHKLEEEEVESMYFVKEMIETTDDENIEALLTLKRKEELEFLGVGLFGENRRLKELTANFKLWS